jgi:hypothetical protein
MSKECIGKWLNAPIKEKKKYKYSLYRITKKADKTTTLIKDLQKDLLYSYREKKFLKSNIFTLSERKIRKYINGIIPKDSTSITDNVRTGDFGEVLVKLIVSFFYGYKAYNKLKFKFNKDRSVFATDLVAFDDVNDPHSIYYYEIKTRKTLNKENGFYITEIAYNSLEKDDDNCVQPILDFMAQRFSESKKKELSIKYSELALNRKKVKSNYEIFVLTNDINENKISKICKALDNMNLKLKPLTLTLVLVPELYSIRDEVWNTICDRAVELSENV